MNSILQQADETINGSRKDSYGSPSESFQTMAELANIQLKHKLKESLDATDIAIFLMLCLKGSRIIHSRREGRYHKDSVMDLCGYAGCLDLIQQELTTEGSEIEC